MTFTRYKKIYNKTYAYQVWKEKDQNGKWKQKSKYLGVIDPQTNTYNKKPQEKQEQQILDYATPTS